MKKHTSKTSDSRSAATDPNKDAASEWLSKRIKLRIEEGQTFLIDLATDLPFNSVLRGRVAPPKEEIISKALPLATVLRKFTMELPAMAVDANYLEERHELLNKLRAFEQAGENFLGLIRRTRAVVAAQLEKAMRQVCKEASRSSHEELRRALGGFAELAEDEPAKK